MNLVTIRLSESEYTIMQAHTAYYLKWCYGHFSHRQSAGIMPEIIVAAMYHKYFGQKIAQVRFPRSGKAFHLEYFEAKAYLDATCVLNDLPSKDLNKQIQEQLNCWKMSYSKPNMETWYKSRPELLDTFGAYDELDDMQFEVINHIYNQLELLS
jgi:hypothetical protein